MKTKRLLVAGLVSAIGLTAVVGFAAPEWRPSIMSMMGGHGMMGGGYHGQHMMKGQGMMGRSGGMMPGQMPMGMSAMTDQLNQLEARLDLNSGQKVLWEEFQKVAESQAESMQEHHRVMFKQFQNSQQMTLPERINQHTQLMGQRFSSMTTFANALKKLYQGLDPQQQKILDQNQFMGGM